MTRTFLLASLLACGSLSGFPFQASPAESSVQSPASKSTGEPPVTQPNTSTGEEENPPEEDESVAPEKFPLNPLESERNIKVGNFYFHRKNFQGAAGRYERATKYNPNSPDAFFKLGEAQQKLKHSDAARSCFERVLQLAPGTKLAGEAKKKLGSLSNKS